MLLPRQLAESTSTQVLDELIAINPHRLEFYRTRGIVHCFRDEYAQAVKDFTHAIREARTFRKARTAHMNSNLGDKQRGKGSKKKKGKAGGSKTNGQAPPNGTSASRRRSRSRCTSAPGPRGGRRGGRSGR